MKRPSALVPVIAGFGVLLLLLLAVTVIGISHVNLISNRLSAIVSNRNQKAEFAATLYGLHEARFQALLLAASQTDPFQRDADLMQFSRLAGDFIQVRERFLKLPLDEDEVRLWDAVRGEVRQAEGKAARIIELIHGDALVEARRLIQQELAPHQKRLVAVWTQLLELQRTKNQAALQEARHAQKRAHSLSIALSALAMLVGLLVAAFVVRMSRRMERDLFEEKERAQVTLWAIGDGVIRFDDARHVEYLNPMAENMLGLTAREALGKPIQEVLKLVDRNDRSDLSAILAGDVLRGDHCELPATTTLISAHGMEYEVEGNCSPIHAPRGGVEGGVLVLRDVTEAREMQRKLVWQANHDGLTGIMNRRAFEDRVSRALVSKRAGEFPMSLLFIDLDHFKQVNDSAGHAAGDELLRQLSALMQTRIRENDLLARLGGDEFAIMLTACPQDVAEKIAGVVRDSIANLQFAWGDQHYQVYASIGVVHVPPHWATLDECLAAADAACYQAKRNGRNEIVVHGQ